LYSNGAVVEAVNEAGDEVTLSSDAIPTHRVEGWTTNEWGVVLAALTLLAPE